MYNRTMILLLVSNAFASVGTGVAMIAIPWMLASQPGGSFLFGTLATIVNICLFLATPLIGPFIDQGSRRLLMIWLRVVFIVGVGVVMAIELMFKDHQSALIVYYVLGAAFYAINIPLRSAYVQELFQGSVYLRVNSILEVENQIAAALTGVIAIFAIKSVGMIWLMSGNVALYCVAVLCLYAIPASHPTARAEQGSYWASLSEGARIAIYKPWISCMLLAASLPYIVVILFTVLHPIALTALPEATASTYAVVELQFAIGAIVGGLSLPWVTGRARNIDSALLLALSGFAAVVVTQALMPTYWGFIALAFGLGLGNAVTRILRQSLIMEQYAGHEAGRINALLQGLIMFGRAILMAVLTSVITAQGTQTALWVLALLSTTAPLVFLMALKLSAPAKIHPTLISKEK